MRVRIAALFLCLALALTLAGCVHADRSVTLSSDGTGTYTFVLGISPEAINLGGDRLVKGMNQFGDDVKKHGGSYTRYNGEDGYSYWKYVRPFSSVSQLNDFLSQSPEAVANPTPSTSSPDTIAVKEDAGFFNTTYHVTGKMSLVVPNANQSTDDLLKDARLSFAVTMPNWVSDHHGGNQSGNTVTYTVHFGEEATIDVTGGGLSVAHIALVIGGMVLALALLVGGFILGFALRRRGARQSAEPVALASSSPYYMPVMPAPPSGDAPTLPGNNAPTYPAPPNWE
jgi:hypothetical protein